MQRPSSGDAAMKSMSCSMSCCPDHGTYFSSRTNCLRSHAVGHAGDVQLKPLDLKAHQEGRTHQKQRNQKRRGCPLDLQQSGRHTV